MGDQERDMTKGADQLLTAYETGKLTRRQLLSALVLAGMSTSVSTQVQVSPLQGRASIFHHVNIFVSNLPRSAAFYQKLGLPSILRPIDPVPGGAAYALDFNNGSFLSVIQTSDPERVARLTISASGSTTSTSSGTPRRSGRPASTRSRSTESSCCT